MLKLSRHYFSYFVALVTVISIGSCKKSFDNPPGFVEPNITANTTIKDLKALHSAGQFEQITDDKIIEGVVIADDKSGNFFLEIVIQDTTGGITVRLDGTNVYTSYPIGRKVYIKCKGLYLNDYNGLIQLGGGVDNTDPSKPALTNIGSTLLDSFIVKGSVNNTITPKVVTLSQLTTNIQDPYLSTLIQLDNYQFGSGDLSKTYADPANKATVSAVNFDIEDCSGNSVILRNSSYADFAGSTVAQGNGSIVAVYSVFRTDKQLLIRDTSDIKFTGARCGGGPIDPGNGSPISITDLRALYTGSNIALGSYKVSGVVISDASSKNISSGSIVLQNGNSGISVYFGGTISYSIGDSIVIDVTAADSLINYKGSLEIKTHYGAAKPTPVATGKVITPKVVTVADLNSGLSASLGSPSNIEFTLVKIAGATSPGGSYSGNKTITDATGNITMYTASAATFSSAAIPTGTIDVVGYGNTFGSTKQFQIRNTGDVTGGTPGGGGGGGGTGTPITVAALRALYSGTGINLSTSYKVTGIVISDAANKNISNGDVIIQDGDAGISVYFGGTITYNIGDQIEVNVTAGDSLINYKGSLEIKLHSGATKPTPLSTGNVVTPAVKTIDEINTSLAQPLGSPDNFEYTLITIAGVTAPSGTYSGSKTITDATGSITLYTATGATFSGSNLLAGSHSYTGFANTFGTTKEFQIRNTNDVQ